jgi:hypothetical protein
LSGVKECFQVGLPCYNAETISRSGTGDQKRRTGKNCF